MGKGSESLEVYQLSEQIAHQIWALVNKWDSFSKGTIGSQIVRAADSIGANIAEGTGRGTYKDNARFPRFARGSFYETRHFLRRAYQRKLLITAQIAALQPLVEKLGPKLNAYIRSIGVVQKRRQTQAASSDK